jgi:hypothetical protein
MHQSIFSLRRMSIDARTMLTALPAAAAACAVGELADAPRLRAGPGLQVSDSAKSLREEALRTFTRVTALTDGASTDTAECPPDTVARAQLMSMTQLVIGTALGFCAAQALLYGLRRLGGALLGSAGSARKRSVRPLPAAAFISGFVRYAPPIALSAALFLLGAWAIKDHLAAKRAGKLPVADAIDPASPAPLADSRGVADDVTALSQPGEATPAAAPATSATDPYSDPEFKAPGRPHHARGGAVSLKDALVQRAEVKARTDLLSETRAQRDRSQYDCEVAAHAEQYIKAGLDVWGFADWQTKYFPAAGYKGATLPECRDIKNVVDPSRVNLQSAVAQGNHS